MAEENLSTNTNVSFSIPKRAQVRYPGRRFPSRARQI